MEKKVEYTEEEIAFKDMEHKKETKERCGHLKVRKGKRRLKIISWSPFYSEYIEACFQMEKMKIQRKEIIQQLLKISDNLMILDDDQWELWN
jgi:DNA-directed RNA polymerase subunit F